MGGGRGGSGEERVAERAGSRVGMARALPPAFSRIWDMGQPSYFKCVIFPFSVVIIICFYGNSYRNFALYIMGFTYYLC